MQAGDTISLRRGRYVLEALLGHSSYGCIWTASGPAGSVALKLVNREQMRLAAPGLRRHWIDCARRETGFLESLSPWDGRHIVRLLDSGEHDTLPALAMERMHTDLARHVEVGARPTLRQALAWMAQANQAIARVHQYGWRYLDLKPSNLLLDARRNTLRLADFGTCIALAAAGPHDYTGTAGWQAPEQILPRQHGRYETSARTDYFALGALFYYLVTGGSRLRFCAACAEAYRLHRDHASLELLARYPGGLATLDASEAGLFLDRVRAQLPWPSRPQADRALALLRSLTAPDAHARPRNALQISRELDALTVECTPARSAAGAWLPFALRSRAS